MQPYDWTTFTKRIPVNASFEIIYQAWTKPAELEKWFLRKANFKTESNQIRNSNERIEQNDNYEWMWYGYDDNTVERGTVLGLNGKDFLKFSFGKAREVSVFIKEEERNNIVEIVQENIPTDEQSKIYYHLGCSEGWTFYLANLKSILEGGIDLRNRNEKLNRAINS